MQDSKHKGAGRPFIAPHLKKKPVNLKLSPWVNDWLNEQKQSKASLIEDAIIKHYGLTPPEINQT